MDLKINSAQPNFRAKMQLRGNIEILKNGEVEVLKHSFDKIGIKSERILDDIAAQVFHCGIMLPNNLVSSSKCCTSYDSDVVEYDDNGNVYSVNGLKTLNFPEITISIGAAEEKPKTDHEDHERYSDSVVKQFHDDPHLM